MQNLIPRKIKDRDKREFIIYGITEGKICKQCNNLKKQVLGNVYYRCCCDKYKGVVNKNFKTSTLACAFFEETK